MSTDLIRYDLLVQEALKSVVRRVLVDAARDGLPGEHHFYISFRTEHGGVRLSNRLRERYPQDMTIVLQHQFENLVVGDGAFEVGLSFSGVPERLRVPFDALSGFFDPSVQFGLKFEINEAEAAEPEIPAAEPTPLKPKSVVPVVPGSLPKPEPKPPRKVQPEEGEDGEKKRSTRKKPASADETTGAEVVSLDAFRKKS